MTSVNGLSENAAEQSTLGKTDWGFAAELEQISDPFPRYQSQYFA